MSDKIRKLHNTYISAQDLESRTDVSPYVKKALTEPHLALYINHDWVPILPGMIIALVTDRTKVNGIAPYTLKKVNTKPGKERIDLIAWSSDGRNQRELKLGAKYTGTYISGINNADEAIEAAVNAQKEVNKDED